MAHFDLIAYLLCFCISMLMKNIVMDLEAKKAIIIERFKHLNDVHLIDAIQNLLDYALIKEKKTYDIPETHQKLVMERFEKVRKNPESLLDWDETKKT